METITFETLLAEGQRKLAEGRAAQAAAEEVAKAEAERKQQIFLDDIRNQIETMLPEALWPYLFCYDPYPGNWRISIRINAPFCAPIDCVYLTQEHRLEDNKPFTVHTVIPGGFYDWNEPYAPQYDVNRRSYWTSDIGMAVAVAREAAEEMARAEQAFAEMCQAKESETPTVDDPGTAGVPVEPPTASDLAAVGEQLAVLIRRIVREELS